MPAQAQADEYFDALKYQALKLNKAAATSATATPTQGI